MSTFARALLDQLEPDDLAALADRLKPYLAGEDGRCSRCYGRPA